MTLYKVTYRLGGSTYSANITERNEAAARKTFKKEYTSDEIVAVEFQRANVQATKSQERDALEKIKQMVEELGPDSYLSTAFEGAFEDAENNISLDFGDSMKRRWENSEKTVEELKAKLESSEKDWEAAHEAAHQIAEEKDREIAVLRAEVEALRKQIISDDDFYDVEQLVKDRESEIEEAAQKAADEIVKYADDPTSTVFRDAVTRHRNYTSSINYTRQLRQRIEAAHAAIHGAR